MEWNYFKIGSIWAEKTEKSRSSEAWEWKWTCKKKCSPPIHLNGGSEFTHAALKNPAVSFSKAMLWPITLADQAHSPGGLLCNMNAIFNFYPTMVTKQYKKATVITFHSWKILYYKTHCLSFWWTFKSVTPTPLPVSLSIQYFKWHAPSNTAPVLV